jgi:hypothetical protein
MQKLLFLSIYILIINIFAENQPFYTIAKSGLNLRAEANTSSKVLTTIAYGEEVIIVTNYVADIKVDNMSGYWVKVKYKNLTGFLVNIYLVPNKAPLGTINSLSDYFSQISTMAYKTEEIKNGNFTDDSEGYSSIQKTLYKNGMEIHYFTGYEFGEQTYFLPNWSKENTFLLLKSITDFKILNDFSIVYPTANKVYKKGEKTVDVKVDANSGIIHISYEEGAMYEITISYQSNQAIVTFSSGV